MKQKNTPRPAAPAIMLAGAAQGAGCSLSIRYLN